MAVKKAKKKTVKRVAKKAVGVTFTRDEISTFESRLAPIDGINSSKLRDLLTTYSDARKFELTPAI